MRATRLTVLVALTLPLGMAAESAAQLFGQRSVGRTRTQASQGPVTRQVAPSLGSVDANARYLRGNRDARDFVGVDSNDQSGFVGVRQAEGDVQVRSAVDSLRIRTAPDANRTAQATTRNQRMYNPRLSVDFEFRQPAGEDVSSRLVGRLQSSLSLSETDRIEVATEDGKAILRGEVQSERSRRLAALLLLFEPGISDVQNDLIVKPPSSSPPSRPSEPVASSPEEDS